MSFYYIDRISESVKLTLDKGAVGDRAYKGLFFDGFGQAREFLKFCYGSVYDREWGLSVYTPACKRLAGFRDELEGLDDKYGGFVEEFNGLGGSLTGLLSEEWAVREGLRKRYEFLLGAYYFPYADFRDRCNKLFFKACHREFVRKHGLTVVEQGEQARLAGGFFEEFGSGELSQAREFYRAAQGAVEGALSEVVRDYRLFHGERRFPGERGNDLKNVMLVLLAERQGLLDGVFREECLIKSLCDGFDRFRLVEYSGLSHGDFKWSASAGYNVFQVLNDRVVDVVFVGNAYNRVGVLNSDLRFARNGSLFVVDDGFVGDPVELDTGLPFWDADEEELSPDLELKARVLNPFLEDFYGKQLFPVRVV